MSDFYIAALPYLIAAYLILTLLKRLMRVFNPYKDTPFGFKGKLVYADKGKNSATFFNKDYGIAAKGGDFIYKTESGIYRLIEYKSRKGRVYESDIAQTIASVLAARSRYPVKEAQVYTETNSKNINVSGTNKDLYNKIKSAHLLTQKIKRGEVVDICYNNTYKCQSCAVRDFCKHKR